MGISTFVYLRHWINLYAVKYKIKIVLNSSGNTSLIKVMPFKLLIMCISVSYKLHPMEQGYFLHEKI